MRETTHQATHPKTLDEALREIERLQAQLQAAQDVAEAPSPATEPTACPMGIAIVGMGCRFPGGANTPAAFWQLLAGGVDAVREIPASRWDVEAYYDPDMSVPGKMYVRSGGYLDEDVSLFDPQFFRMSAREAAHLDPQQRLLLEVSWEALENAGIAPTTLKGTQTGIFVGQYWDDYSMQRIYTVPPEQIDRYVTLSGLRGLSAGRIAHLLGTHGPAMQMDTACSSSALAIHLACQSLRNGESDVALAGGVSLILAPEHLLGLCQMKALSPDGRCKTFSADADGFGRGEGCGIVILKRLADATRDGDRILALIRGSAANHDGQSRTVTTPNGLAQRAMLRQALENADVEPHQLHYIEAHGTGTSLGDPIEVRSLAKELCQERETPLWIGSVKTNIGHLDAAAGVAGLMKVVLSLQHGKIPPHLHFTTPNPRIPWDKWPLRVPTELTPWNSEGAKGRGSEGARGQQSSRIAGVSSFGMSGTNVHLIVEQAPASARGRGGDGATGRQEPPLHLLTLSAKDRETQRELAQAYFTHLAQAEERELADICFTAAVGRTHFKHRLAVIGKSNEQMCSKLSAFLENGTSTHLGAVNTRKRAKVAFLFTGQGSQYVDMGRTLYETQPTFRQTLEQCDEILRHANVSNWPHLAQPLLSVLYPKTGETSLLNQTAYTQPALFALEYALAQLWKSWGIEPDIVMGHSVGEIVAACMAGVFSLEDGLKLIAARGRLMQALPQEGQMVSVMANESLVRELIAPYSDQVSIAAVNGPQSVVISGFDEAIQRVVATLQAQGIKTRQLTVSHAFHSPLMEPMLADFAQVAEQISYSTPKIAFVSNVTGQLATSEVATAAYWVRHVREAVQFMAGMTTLYERSCQVFIEIGPNPILLGMGRQCLPDENGVWLPSLRPNAEWPTMLASIAQLYVQGVEIDWTGVHGSHSCRKIVLPTYPFQRERLWVDLPVSRQASENQDTRPLSAQSTIHPLLGRRLDLAASNEVRFESQISLDLLPYLKDHRVVQNPPSQSSVAIMPATAYQEMALAAGSVLFKSSQLVVEELVIEQALILPADEVHRLQVVLTPKEQQVYSFQVFSRSGSQEQGQRAWKRHALGRVQVASPSNDPLPKSDWSSMAQSMDSQTTETFYQLCREQRLDYGPNFQAVERLFRCDGEALGQIRLPEALLSQAGEYQLHPVLLDACTHIMLAAFPETLRTQAYLPISISRLQLYRRPAKSLWSYVQLQINPSSSAIVSGNIQLFDEIGLIGVVQGFTLKSFRKFQLPAPRPNLLYEMAWQPLPKALNIDQRADVFGHWLIFTDEEGFGNQLAQQLAEQGANCVLVYAGTSYERKQNSVVVNPTEPEHFQRLLEQTSGDLRGIVHLWSLNKNGIETGCGSVLHLVQALAKKDLSPPKEGASPRLWLVTKGSQSVNGRESVALWQAPLWGLGKVIALEHPELSCVCLDLDPDEQAMPYQGDKAASFLFNELFYPYEEPLVAYRGGKRYVARLRRYIPHNQAPAKADEDDSPPLLIYAANSYLITGGVGALGLLVAEWMVEQGARHLVLASRRGAVSSSAQEVINKLEGAGAKVLVVKADVAKQEDVALLLAKSEAFAPLRGIIHAAGVLDDGILQQQNWPRFSKTMAPKIAGSWNLHTLTQQMRLDFFVLFSSVTSLIGRAGQGNYAAANAFMDALAHYRQHRDLPALSINWGGWAANGMTSNLEKKHLKGQGMKMLTPEQGLWALGRLLKERAVQVGVVLIEGDQYQQRYSSGGGNLSLLSELLASEKQSESSQPIALWDQLNSVIKEEREALLISYLQNTVSEVLGISRLLEVSDSLNKMGVDSLMALELRNRLQSDLRIDIPFVTFLEDTTIAELSTLVSQQFSSSVPSASSLNTEIPRTLDTLSTESEFDLAAVEQSEGLLANLEQLSEEELDALLVTMWSEKELSNE